MIKKEILELSIQKGKAKADSVDGFNYLHFREEFRGIPRGTIIFKNRIILGYPHIKRIFTLEKGIAKNIGSSRIFVEEKIDGYNVRVALVDRRVCGFSRGGFLDLFVSEKAGGAGYEKFFLDNPEFVLCGEMIGNTPHTQSTNKFDTKLMVFDIMDSEGNYLPCDKKYKLLDEYSIQSVPRYGEFDATNYEKLKQLIIKLNNTGAEGIIIRGLNGSQIKKGIASEIVKYVTPDSDIRDIAECSGKFFDMPIGFYHQRIMRSALFIDDFKLDKNEYAKKLGMAFYQGLTNVMAGAKAGKPVVDEHEITIKNTDTWEQIKRSNGKEVIIEEIWRKEEKGQTRIRFKKIYKNTTRRINSYINGKAESD